MNETAMQDTPAQAAQMPDAEGLPKPKRLPNQSCYRPPKDAKSANPKEPLGWSVSVVPVSSVARDWGVSARRVRVMLATRSPLWPPARERLLGSVLPLSLRVRHPWAPD